MNERGSRIASPNRSGHRGVAALDALGEYTHSIVSMQAFVMFDTDPEVSEPGVVNERKLQLATRVFDKHEVLPVQACEIGRASCRERVFEAV